MDFFVSLHTADPGETLSHEVSYPGYQRQRLPSEEDGRIMVYFPLQIGGELSLVTHVVVSDQDGRKRVPLALSPILRLNGNAGAIIIIDPGPGFWGDDAREDLMAAVRSVARSG